MPVALLLVVLQDEWTKLDLCLGRISVHLQGCCMSVLASPHGLHPCCCIPSCQAETILVQRGRVPIVVGGTGLYLRWLVHGRPQTPKSEPMMAARAQEALHQVHCITSLPVSPLSFVVLHRRAECPCISCLGCSVCHLHFKSPLLSYHALKKS